MIRAIEATLPIMTAIMISPIPLAGLIVVLTSKRGAAKSVAYGMGFFAGVWLPTFLLAWSGQMMIGVSGSAGAAPRWGALIHGGAGAVLVVVGSVVLVKHFSRTRPATEPGWMKKLDSASMLLVFGMGGLIVFLNPKNLPLMISAAADYAQASLGMAQLALAATVLAAIGSLLIFLPIVLVQLARKSSARLCEKMRPWLVAHNAAILATVCLTVGAVMLGKALYAGGV